MEITDRIGQPLTFDRAFKTIKANIAYKQNQKISEQQSQRQAESAYYKKLDEYLKNIHNPVIAVLRKRCEESGYGYKEMENSGDEFYLEYELSIENMSFNISFEPSKSLDGVILNARNGVSKMDSRILDFKSLTPEYLEESISSLLQTLSY